MLWVCRSFKLNKFLYSHPIWNTSDLTAIRAKEKVLRSTNRVFVNQSKRTQLGWYYTSRTAKGKLYTYKQPFHQSSSLLRPINAEIQFAFHEMKHVKRLKPNENLTELPKCAKMSSHSDTSSSQQVAENNLQNISAYVVANTLLASTPAASPQLFAPVNDDSNKPTSEIDSFENTKDKMAYELANMRYWEPTTASVQTKKTSLSSHNNKMEFTIMSYNILAQQLLEDNCYLYYKCDQKVLSWKYRYENLIKEIVQSKANIICFQEMQYCDYFDLFKPKLESYGFESLYKKRTGNKNDGCAIFYQTSHFCLEWHQDVEYRHPDVRMLDRDNIGLVAVFHPILETGRISTQPDAPKLCVATTHLLFNPRRGDIKLAQLQILLAELDRLAFRETSVTTGKPLYHPTILCGDMNSEPYSPLYNFITGGQLVYQGIQSGNISGQTEGINRGREMGPFEIQLMSLGITEKSQYKVLNNERLYCQEKLPSNQKRNENKVESGNHYQISESTTGQLDHSFSFHSAYRHQNQAGTNFITTENSKANCTVDYIFYSNTSSDDDSRHEDEHLRLLETYKLLTDTEVKKMGGLPNAVQSSDHTSLIAKFCFQVTPL